MLAPVELGSLHQSCFDISYGTWSGLWRDENSRFCSAFLIQLVKVTGLFVDELGPQRTGSCIFLHCFLPCSSMSSMCAAASYLCADRFFQSWERSQIRTVALLVCIVLKELSLIVSFHLNISHIYRQQATWPLSQMQHQPHQSAGEVAVGAQLTCPCLL